MIILIMERRVLERLADTGLVLLASSVAVLSLGLGISACSSMEHQQSPDGYDVNVDAEDD